jgi:SAM-dependent methyltransferase
MSNKLFKDHFSEHAHSYAKARLTYPPDIFAWLAEIVPHQRVAWDCGTGNGQAAIGLANHFERVLATDASTSQIAYAILHARIEYSVARESQCRLADGDAALVTAFSAVHWFNQKAFFAEAQRVLGHQGVCAIWCLSLLRITPHIDTILDGFHHETLASWWPPERALVDAHYQQIEFPFVELDSPGFCFEKHWTLVRFAKLLRSWSGVLRYQAALGHDPIDPLIEQMLPFWGNDIRRVTWHLCGRIGRVEKQYNVE